MASLVSGPLCQSLLSHTASGILTTPQARFISRSIPRTKKKFKEKQPAQSFVYSPAPSHF